MLLCNLDRRLTRIGVFIWSIRRITELHSEYPLDILHLFAYQMSDHTDRRFLNVTTGPLWQLRIANLADIESYHVVRGKLRG